MFLKFNQTKNGVRGFTLIEVMVVTSIIGILASTVMTNLNEARIKGRIAQRASMLHEVKTALEFYRADNGHYPITSNSTPPEWWHNCNFGLPREEWIPGLVPDYISSLPTDPVPAPQNQVLYCYMYSSNGDDYKVLLPFNATEMRDNNSAGYLSRPTLIDPARDGGSQQSVVDPDYDNAQIQAWASYTEGAKAW